FSRFRLVPNRTKRRDAHGWQQTNNAGLSRLIGSAIFLLLLAAYMTVQGQTQFEWRDATGDVRSLSNLHEILRENRQWIESGKKAGTPADLNGANLTGAPLQDADLRDAKLFRTNLTDATLFAAD